LIFQKNGIDICGHASNYLATVVHTRSSINMLTNDERKEIFTKMKAWQPRMSVKKQAQNFVEHFFFFFVAAVVFLE
jgi:hypothetical protein